MEEHRQHIRVSKALTISYKIPSQFITSGCSSKNISGGGICMPIMQGYASGLVLELKFKLRELSVPIIAFGKIVWTRKTDNAVFPFEIGVTFIEIDPRDRYKIMSHIQQDNSGVVKWLE